MKKSFDWILSFLLLFVGIPLFVFVSVGFGFLTMLIINTLLNVTIGGFFWVISGEFNIEFLWTGAWTRISIVFGIAYAIIGGIRATSIISYMGKKRQKNE